MSAVVIGGLTFMGTIVTADYEETGGADINVDDFGIDVLTRNFNILPQASSISAFMTDYIKGTQDTAFPWMFVVDRKIKDVRGPLATGTVTFKGATIAPTANPKNVRKPMVKFGTAQLTCTLESITEGRSRDVIYLAPWTEYKYISANDPKLLGPVHSGEIFQNNKNVEVITSKGTYAGMYIYSNYLLPTNGSPKVTKAVTDNFELIGFQTVLTTKFEVEQVGSVYAVTERNQLTLMDFRTAQLNYYVQNPQLFKP